MRIAVVGPLVVRTDDDVPVVVPGAKERLLLAALAAEAPAAVSEDRLAETLWNGTAPPTARRSLQIHVVRLRSALEPDRPKGSTGRYVVRRGHGYALAVERRELDALLLTDLVARGRARLRSGEPGPAAEALRSALALWRGEPYADWPDAEFARAERRRLGDVRAGAEAALIEADLTQGRHAEVIPDLERLVAVEPLRENWWRLLMLALYRDGRQADALAAGRRLRSYLAEELGADPGPAVQAMEAAILAQDERLGPEPAQSSVQGDASAPQEVLRPATVCPYKGLATYQPDDAYLFHGRGRMIARLVARLVDTPLLLVSGPSGAGKSSVVRAGLLPALRQGAVPGSEGWSPVIVTPGSRPVDALAALTGEFPPDAPVVLVCDQFEELWAPGVDPAERRAFLDAVTGLIDDGIVVRCVAVMRGDHVGRLAEHPPFTDRLGSTLVLVPPLTPEELREIVLAPAAAVGLTVDPELVDTVVGDVLGRVGGLPLLSTALVGTWERRRGTELTLAGYLQAGEVAGALTRLAEVAYHSLDEAGRDVARHLLVRLADAEDGGALVRRPVPLAELDLDGEDGNRRRSVVEVFVERRLLALDGDRLEVAHEALLTSWPRLARWLDDDAAARAVRRHLAPAARGWDALGRPAAELYGGARLAAALDVNSGVGDLTPLERQFLLASQAHADAELRAARDRASTEVAARHRTRRLAQWLAAVLVAALVAAGLAVYFQRDADGRAIEAERASVVAERASLVADANGLSARTSTAGSLDVALLLAAQAARLADTPETRDGLLTLLGEHRRVVRAVPFDGRVQGGTLSGSRLFLGVGNDIVSWDLDNRGLPRPVVGPDDLPPGWGTADGSPTGSSMVAGGVSPDGPWTRLIGARGEVTPLVDGAAVGGSPIGISFSADGEQVLIVVAGTAVGGAGGATWRIHGVDADGGAPVGTLGDGTIPAPPDSLSADIDPTVTTAVIGDDEGSAVLVDLTDGRQTAVAVARRDVASRGFRALPGGTAAQLWDDGTVTRYDADGARAQDLDAHGAAVRDVVLSPAGGWAATVGDDAAVVRWQVDRRTGDWSEPETLTAHRGAVMVAETAEDPWQLVTAGVDDTVITWDMSPDGNFGADYPDLSGQRVSNRPRTVQPGRSVVVPTRPSEPVDDAERAGAPVDTLMVSATFLDPDSGRVLAQVPVGETLPGVLLGSSVGVSPDGGTVAVTWGYGTTLLDTQSRTVDREIVLPGAGSAGEDGRPLPATPVWCAAWTPDGSRLLLGAEGDLVSGTGGSLVVVDPVTGRVVDRRDVGVTPQAIAASPDGSLLAVASAGTGEVVILDAGTLEVERTVQLLDEDRLFDLAFSPDGRLLAAAGEAGMVHVLDTGTWRPEEPVAVHADVALQVEWLPDDRTVVSSALDGTVALVDAVRGLVRAAPLPASDTGAAVGAHVMPGPDRELIAFSGERSGRRYPLEASSWLSAACGIAGRDLTRDEWQRHLPGRPYRQTCSDVE